MDNAEKISRYPLQWPAGWKRTKGSDRMPGHFGKAKQHYGSDGKTSWRSKENLTVFDGVKRCLSELKMLRVYEDDVVISTNVRTRLDGLPVSGAPEPADPGVAVYWRKNRSSKCIAVDIYTKVADNLAAIAATIDAMRAIERHGGAEILDRVFLGFQSLPPPNGDAWWQILGFDTSAGLTRSSVDDAYREFAKKHHPDVGGDPELFKKLNQAIAEARRQIV